MRSLSTSRVPDRRASTRRTVSPAEPPGPATTTVSAASEPSVRSSTGSSSSTSTRPSTGTPAAASTESVMPATSSMTIAPGSFTPSARSARSAAHVPITVTATKKSTRPACENGTSHSTSTVTTLATVPGATGAQPTPPTVAIATVSRSVAESVRLRTPPNELVPFPLGDAHAREASRRGGAVAKIDDAVDLRRLARCAAFPREGGILARPVHEDVDHGAHELGVALERHDVVRILDDRRALGRGLGVDLIGEVGRRRALFRRIREHAESIEAGVVEEAQEILERSGRLAGEAD